jgi:hypothetical protein
MPPPVAGIEPPARLNCQNATVQINGAGSSQGANFTYQWSTANGHIVSGETTLTPVGERQRDLQATGDQYHQRLYCRLDRGRIPVAGSICFRYIHQYFLPWWK